MRLKELCAALLSAAAVTGCADATRAVAPSDQPAPTYYTPTPEDIAEMPAEYARPATIQDLSVGVGFADDIATATAILQYYSNYAKVTATIRLLRDGTQLGSPVSSVEAQSDFWPWFRTLSAITFIPVPGQCGHTVHGDGHALVWMQFPVKLGTWFRWSEHEATTAGYDHQPRCSNSCASGKTGGSDAENGSALTSQLAAPALQCTGTGSGDEPWSGGYWIAVRTTTCYGTHYYDSEGRYLHSQIHFCETTTSYYYQA